jgi:uncharacterized protein YraI
MTHRKGFSKSLKRLFSALLAITFLAGFSQYIYASENENDAEYLEFVTTANLNLRAGPSTSYDRITLIPAGTTVFITEYVPDIPDQYYTFSSVMFGEISGYVASRFITPRPVAPIMPVSTAPAEASQPTLPPPPAINGNIEKISWWTMRHNILTTGTTIQIYDIRSGLTYNVRAFSLGNHADVETLTVEDTNIMRQTSGGQFSWDARPVLATFNGRTFAAAIHTMPHAGSTIHTNGKNGHICLHFFESTPHNGNRSWQAEMQAAVRTAFNHN